MVSQQAAINVAHLAAQQDRSDVPAAFPSGCDAVRDAVVRLVGVNVPAPLTLLIHTISPLASHLKDSCQSSAVLDDEQLLLTKTPPGLLSPKLETPVARLLLFFAWICYYTLFC